MVRKLEFPNADNLVERYQSGTSLKQLANECGHSRPALARLLREHNIPIRGRSEAERIKWSIIKQDRTAVERQMNAAWVASRGRTDSTESKVKRALGFFRNQSKQAGLYELDLAAILTGLGLDISWQYPIRHYNVDLAICIDRVAVEVQSYQHRMPTSSIRSERIENILDDGWSVLMVYIPQKAVPDLCAIAQQIHSFCKLARRDKSISGQYGMVGCDGQAITPERFDLPDRPRVPGF